MYRLKITIILLSFLKLSSSSLCNICFCTKSDGMTVFNCDKKLSTNSSDLDLLLYLYKESPDKFILSNNGFTELSVEPLRNLKNLTTLNLSHNFLNGFNSRLSEYWTKVEDLDLSFNQWTLFNIESIIDMPLLSKLDLSHNFIANFTPVNLSKQSHLTHLNISHNKFTTITNRTLNNFPFLQYIDLSFNSIRTIDIHSFSALSSLATLLLKHNFLKILEANFSNSLKTLDVSYNKLSEFPCNLSVNYLSIDSNIISKISINNTNMYRQLEYLNISRNLLSTFVDAEFLNLTTLDISYNNFTIIPVTVNTNNLPTLDTLVISGNPINKLKFNADLKLRRLVVRNFSLLSRVDEDAFDYLREYDNDCINMTISSNKNLELFNEKALQNISICYLDLEKNALKRISQHMDGLQDDFFFKYGLNMQGNPLVCDCASQWMLDNLIPKLYNLNPELLTDLRCNEPQELSKVRLIHWYKWKNKIFCDDRGSILEHSIANDSKTIYMEPMSSTIVIESSKISLFIITSCAILLAVLIIAGLVFSLRLTYTKRRQNRRF